jgi:hypothetical protein
LCFAANRPTACRIGTREVFNGKSTCRDLRESGQRFDKLSKFVVIV